MKNFTNNKTKGTPKLSNIWRAMMIFLVTWFVSMASGQAQYYRTVTSWSIYSTQNGTATHQVKENTDGRSNLNAIEVEITAKGNLSNKGSAWKSLDNYKESYIHATQKNYIHHIVWAKKIDAGAVTAIVCIGTGTTGTATLTNKTAPLSTTWSVITLSRQMSSNTTYWYVPHLGVTTHAITSLASGNSMVQAAFDDGVIYISNSSTTDLTAPAKVNITGNSNGDIEIASGTEIEWAAGTDTGTGATGVKHTLIWQRLSGTDKDLSLYQQGGYNTPDIQINASGQIGGVSPVWKLISITADNGAADSFTPLAEGVYAIVHRDLAYNYSEPAYIIVEPAGECDDIAVNYNVTATTTAICSGISTATIGLSGSQTNVSYQLYNGSTKVGDPVNGTGTAITFAPVSPTSTTTYTVKGKGVDGAYCTSEKAIDQGTPTSQTVTVNNPTISAAGNATTVAFGGTLQLSAVTPGGSWNASNGNATVSSTGLVSGVKTGTVDITYDLGGGCSDTYELEVVVEPICAYVSAGSTGQSLTLGNYTLYPSTSATTYTSTNLAGGTRNACGNADFPYYYHTNVAIYLNGSGATEIMLPGHQGANIQIKSVYVADALMGTYTELPNYTKVDYTANTCASLGIKDVNIPQGKYVLLSFNEFRINGLCITPSTCTPTTIAGGQTEVCVDNTTTAFTTTATGSGTWSTSDNNKATVNTSGVVTGVAAGAVNVIFTPDDTDQCSASKSITVITPPTANAGTDISDAVVGVAKQLGATAAAGGTWSIAPSSAQTNGTFAASGTANTTFTANAEGIYTLRWTITNPCGGTEYDDITLTATEAAGNDCDPIRTVRIRAENGTNNCGVAGTAYAYDNGGAVTISTTENDNSLWYEIPAGTITTTNGIADVFYYKNVQTGRYLYRNSTDAPASWIGEAAVTAATNGETDFYKWYPMPSVQWAGRTRLWNVAGGNFTNPIGEDTYEKDLCKNYRAYLLNTMSCFENMYGIDKQAVFATGTQNNDTHGSGSVTLVQVDAAVSNPDCEPTGCVRTPFASNTAATDAVNTYIWASWYDDGGQDCAYDNKNVDAEQPNRRHAGAPEQHNAGNNSSIGWTTNGDWMLYTIKVPAAGDFQLETEIAGGCGGASMSFDILNNADLLATTVTQINVAVSNADGWDVYPKYTSNQFNLAAGTYVIKATIGDCINFRGMRLVPYTPPAAIPVPTNLAATPCTGALAWDSNDENTTGFEVKFCTDAAGTTDPWNLRSWMSLPDNKYKFTANRVAVGNAGNNRDLLIEARDNDIEAGAHYQVIGDNSTKGTEEGRGWLQFYLPDGAKSISFNSRREMTLYWSVDGSSWTSIGTGGINAYSEYTIPVNKPQPGYIRIVNMINGTNSARILVQSITINEYDCDPIIETNSTANSYTPTGLDAGTTYYTSVRNVTASGTSEWSNAATFTTTPATPAGLTVTDITHNSAHLSWEAVTGATQYLVTVNGAGVTLTDASAGTNLYYDVTGLTPETSGITWSVKAVISSCQSAAATGTSFNTVKDCTGKNYEAQVAPTSVYSGDQVNLSLTSTTGVSATVWQSSNTSDGEYTGNLGTTPTVTAETWYRAEITTTDGCTVNSTPVQVTLKTLGKASNLDATIEDCRTDALLTWDPVTDATSYKVHIKECTGGVPGSNLSGPADVEIAATDAKTQNQNLDDGNISITSPTNVGRGSSIPAGNIGWADNQSNYDAASQIRIKANNGKIIAKIELNMSSASGNGFATGALYDGTTYFNPQNVSTNNDKLYSMTFTAPEEANPTELLFGRVGNSDPYGVGSNGGTNTIYLYSLKIWYKGVSANCETLSGSPFGPVTNPEYRFEDLDPTKDYKFTVEAIRGTNTSRSDEEVEFTIKPPVGSAAPVLTFVPAYTQPTITSDVKLDAQPTITADKPMFVNCACDPVALDPTTELNNLISSGKLTFKKVVQDLPVVDVPFTATLVGNMITITPTTTLEWDTQYNLTISDICDGYGNTITEESTIFRTEPEPMPCLKVEEIAVTSNGNTASFAKQLYSGEEINMGVVFRTDASSDITLFRVTNGGTGVLELNQFNSGTGTAFIVSPCTKDGTTIGTWADPELSSQDTLYFSVSFPNAGIVEGVNTYAITIETTNNTCGNNNFGLTFKGYKAKFGLPYTYESCGETVIDENGTIVKQDYASKESIPAEITLGGSAQLFPSYDVYQAESNCKPSGCSALRIGNGTNKLEVTVPAEYGVGKVTIKWVANGYRKATIKCDGETFLNTRYLKAGECYTHSVVVKKETETEHTVTIEFESFDAEAGALTTLYYLEITPYDNELLSSSRDIVEFTVPDQESSRVLDDVIFITYPNDCQGDETSLPTTIVPNVINHTGASVSPAQNAPNGIRKGGDNGDGTGCSPENPCYFEYTVQAQDPTLSKTYKVYIEKKMCATGMYENVIEYETSMNTGPDGKGEDQLLEVLEITNGECNVPADGAGARYTIYYLDGNDKVEGDYLIDGPQTLCVGSTAEYTITNAPVTNNPRFAWFFINEDVEHGANNLTKEDILAWKKDSVAMKEDYETNHGGAPHPWTGLLTESYQGFSIVSGAGTRTVTLKAPTTVTTDVDVKIIVTFIDENCNWVDGIGGTIISATTQVPSPAMGVDMNDCATNGELHLKAIAASGEGTITASRYSWFFTPDMSRRVLMQTADEILLNINNMELVPGYDGELSVKIQAQNACGVSETTVVSPIDFATIETRWTGAVSNDWFDNKNWTANVPKACTNVTIPDLYAAGANGLKPFYPIIDKAAECRNITFEQGGAVKGLRHLSYEKAFVHLDLEREHWYTLTAPLHSMFSGDYYFNGNPISYMRLFAGTKHPDGNGFENPTGMFDRSFADNTVPLELGIGFAFKIGENGWSAPNKLEKNRSTSKLLFPRMTTDSTLIHQYIPYSPLTGRLYPLSSAQTVDKTEMMSIQRGDGTISVNKAYRFIVEDDNGVMEQNPTIVLKPGLNLVGNPRMVHLDLSNFITHSDLANSLYLWNGKHGEQSYLTMTIVDDEAFWNSPGYAGSLVAPMQSFVVKNITGNDVPMEIHLDGHEDNQGVGGRPGENMLRAARQQLNRLYVATEGGLSTAIVMKENASNDLDDMDASKLFSEHTEGVEVYTVEGNRQLDINFFKEAGYLVPLGLRYNADLRVAGNNKTRLTFNGAESFYEVDVFLKNVTTGEEFNLKETQSIDYEMESHADFGNLFIEFRKAQDVTDDRVATDAGNIQIFAKDNNVIRAVSSMDNPIKEINVMTETGKSLVNAKNLNTSIYDLTVNNGAQIYLVRVVTEREVKVEKVLLR